MYKPLIVKLFLVIIALLTGIAAWTGYQMHKEVEALKRQAEHQRQIQEALKHLPSENWVDAIHNQRMR